MHQTFTARATTAAAGLLLLIGGLTACSGGETAAQEAAQTYVDLIATGGDELDALARMTVSDRPDQVEAAALMLAGATERIEVLDVSEVHDAADGSIAYVPPQAGLDTGSAVAATVRYRLDGTEHASDLVLAPYADVDRDEVDAWAVVVPLMGELQLNAADGDTRVPLDQYLAGIQVTFPYPNSMLRAPLYPGVYQLSRRADQYLTSPTEQVTIVSGEEVEPPPAQVEGTDEVAPLVADDLAAQLDACPNPQCPDQLESLLAAYGVDSVRAGDYTLEVTTEPSVQLAGRTAQFTGGELRLDLRDGPESISHIPFAGSGSWYVDRLSGRPYLATVQEIVEHAS